MTTGTVISGSAQFVGELSYERWQSSTEFHKGDHKDRLLCQACSHPTGRQPKPRWCPLSLSVLCEERAPSLYIQQHEDLGVKVPLPDLRGLVTGDTSKIKFIQVTPIARHQEDHYLLQYEVLTEGCEPPQDRFCFLAISPLGTDLGVFSTGTHTSLDVLACSRGTGSNPPLACLFSYDECFHTSNTLSVEIFCNSSCGMITEPSLSHRLDRTHTLAVHLPAPPSTTLPMLLFHAQSDFTLLTFNLSPGRQAEFRSAQKWWICDCNLSEQHFNKRKEMSCVMEQLAVTTPKFRNAMFSPDGYLLAISFSTTDLTQRGIRNVVVLLLNSHTLQKVKSIILPLQHLSQCPASGNWRDWNSHVCYVSFTPLFSTCGQKMAVAKCIGRKVCACIYKIPVCQSLLSQCRRALRRSTCMKTSAVKDHLPPVLQKYMDFY